MFQFVIVISNGQAKGKCYQLFANGCRLLCYIVNISLTKIYVLKQLDIWIQIHITCKMQFMFDLKILTLDKFTDQYLFIKYFQILEKLDLASTWIKTIFIFSGDFWTPLQHTESQNIQHFRLIFSFQYSNFTITRYTTPELFNTLIKCIKQYFSLDPKIE